jgi:hypothetical protein
MTSLEDVILAPLIPAEVPSSQDWIELERRIGSKLPGSYKSFISRYGSGCIDNFLWILNPFSKYENLNLEKQIEVARAVLSDLIEDGENIPYSIYPERSGLLPVGRTDNGDIIYWVTDGRPDDWSIAINEARGPSWWSYRGPFDQFLIAILLRESVCDIFPDNFPSDHPSFRQP